MPSLTSLPPDRLAPLNDVPLDPARDVVVYWQVMARRTRHNFALQHAVETARALGRPLVVLEALRAGHPWASDRLHRFALDGMADDAAAYARAGVPHLAYVEPEAGAGHGLLETLGARACLVVTDEFPEFFLPRMLAAAGRRLARAGTRLEAVDGNGLLPMRVAGRAWPTAPHFRRMLQRELPAHLTWFPTRGLRGEKGRRQHGDDPEPDAPGRAPRPRSARRSRREPSARRARRLVEQPDRGRAQRRALRVGVRPLAAPPHDAPAVEQQRVGRVGRGERERAAEGVDVGVERDRRLAVGGRGHAVAHPAGDDRADQRVAAPDRRHLPDAGGARQVRACSQRPACRVPFPTPVPSAAAQRPPAVRGRAFQSASTSASRSGVTPALSVACRSGVCAW
jgi:hypothetical protein